MKAWGAHFHHAAYYDMTSIDSMTSVMREIDSLAGAKDPTKIKDAVMGRVLNEFDAIVESWR